MTKKLLLLIGILICVIVLVSMTKKNNGSVVNGTDTDSFFSYSFDSPGTLEETGNMEESESPYWWLNSGGYLHIQDGIGRTIRGPLPASDVWRFTYGKVNPRDTDNGYHPQNVFRLVTKNAWENYLQESYFQILSDNVSNSENRNESNGLLLFLRYINEDNLYYAGIRVDGMAVLKKKVDGTYYILGEAPIVPGPYAYNRNSNPNVLPKNLWIGVRAEIFTISDEAVHIKLYSDVGKTGEWKLVLDVIDRASETNKLILGAGHAGIRTDFMDVMFDDYRVVNISS